MPSSAPEHLARECLAATIGAAIADGLFNPLYVLQIRAQLQPGVGTLRLARAAVAEKGVFGGLWMPGLFAVCLRGGFGGFRVGTYPAVREVLPGDGFATRMSAGVLTGAVGMVLFNPAEVIRVRMAGPKPYSSTLAAVGAIAREEGVVAGLWRGTSPNVARAAIYSGAQLATYETAKRGLLDCRAFEEEGPALHVTASFLSGLCAQTACQPADTVKTVLMESRGTSASTWAVLAELISKGGVARLYSGLVPALACKGPVVTLFLPLVEQIRYRLFGLDYL